MVLWILKDESLYPQYHIHFEGLLISPDGSINPSPFNKGKKIGQSQQAFQFKSGLLSKYGSYTDKLSFKVQGPENLFVISESLFKFIKQCNVDAEYFNLELLMEEKAPTQYKIVNVLDLVYGIDEDQSSLIYKDQSYSKIESIEKLVFNETINDVNSEIFIIGKTSFPLIVVKNELKNKIEKAGFKGLNFCKIEDFVK